MNKIFVALLAIFLLQTSVQAADKIRISTPGDAAHFTMHLAQKRGFLKEEGFDAEVITISGPVANVALSNGDTDYFSGFGSALRSILQGLPLRIVACYRPTPHFMLQSRPEFKSVKDLKGKTIGITAFGSGTELVGRTDGQALRPRSGQGCEVGSPQVRAKAATSECSRVCSMPRWPLSRPITSAGRWASLSSYDRKTSLPIPSAA